MKLSNEQQRLVDIISHFGCLDVNQAYILLEPSDKKMSTILINMLVKNNIIDIVYGNYLVIHGSDKNKYVDKNMINCIWAMMDLVKKPSEIDEAMLAVKPAKIYVTINNKDSYELVPLSDSNSTIIKCMQERYSASVKQFPDLNTWCTFVTDNIEIVRKIKSYNLEIPFVVIYLGENDENGKPLIKKLKNRPK